MPFSRREQNTGTVISCFVLLLFSTYIFFGIFGAGEESFILMGLGILLFLIFSTCFFVQHRLRKKEKHAEIDYLNLGIQRHFLGLFMVFYGLPKLFGGFFDYQLFALDSKLSEISEFELAWYYFGKNNWQELFSGLLEIVPGLLLFHRRTYYAGALVLLFVTSQVFVLNFFFKIGGLTFPAATILLACNMYILYSQKEKILFFFRSLVFTLPVNFGRKTTFVLRVFRWLMWFLLAFVIFIKVRPEVFKSEYRKRYGKLVGKYSLEKVIKNSSVYKLSSDSTLYQDLYIEKQSRWNILRKVNGETAAFILELRTKNDSLKLFINRGGIGDSPDIIDTLTALKGTYELQNDLFIVKGRQLKDTLVLTYRKQNLKPKTWIW